MNSDGSRRILRCGRAGSEDLPCKVVFSCPDNVYSTVALTAIRNLSIYELRPGRQRNRPSIPGTGKISVFFKAFRDAVWPHAAS